VEIFTFHVRICYIVYCSIAVRKDGTIQMEKHGVAAFLLYFLLLLMLVLMGIRVNISLLNIVYLVVVLSCSLKFILIINHDKK
jgi:hypothetical protein